MRAAWLFTMGGTGLSRSHLSNKNKKSIHKITSAKNTKGFMLNANAKSPVKNACNARCKPQPAQNKPVYSWMMHVAAPIPLNGLISE